MGSTKKERPPKRQLVRWTDDLDKQVLLAVQYACNEGGVRIPWDDVAHLMGEITGEDKFSGGGIVQHISKLRSKMEVHKIKVPPPLKRGTITNAPSKVYATGNKRKGGPSTAKNPKSSTAKPKKAKPRNVKSEWEDEDDSEDIPVKYDDNDDDNDDDDSDEEYGSAKKKRRVSGGQKKAKRQNVAAIEKEEDERGRTAKVEKPILKAGSGIERGPTTEAGVQQRIESLSPLPRTRGIKHNYSKMDAGSEDYGNEDDDAQAVEEAEEEQYFKEEVKFTGEVSPRTQFETSVTSASGFVDLTHDSVLGNADTGFDLGLGSTYNFGQPFGQPYGQQTLFQTQQYQMPGLTGLGFPHSTSNSFSTNRTASLASLTSATAQPAAYVNPVSYASMVNEDTTTNSNVEDKIMYGGQYTSPTGYSSPFFSDSFDPFA